jgi:hypothetical protein
LGNCFYFFFLFANDDNNKLCGFFKLKIRSMNKGKG